MTMLTADEIVEQALSRVGELGVYPSARGVMYRRIGYRQRQLFQLAAKVNPERYGTCASANLTTSMADLNDIVAPTPTPASVDRVEVLDAGTSGYAVGTEITIVGVNDMDAELAPRAFLRNGVLIGVSTDLVNVVSVRVYYPRLPDLFALTDSAKEIELEAPWDTLLELDLAMWLLEKATQMAGDARAAAMAAFSAEETALRSDFLAAVVGYTPVVSRFTMPRELSRD